MRSAAADTTCPPTWVVDSGGGYQLGYRLTTPVPATPENVELAEGIGRALAKRFGGDPVVFNIDRIMRLPWTVNVLAPNKLAQGRKPALARVLEEGGKTYTLAQLAEWTPPIGTAARAKGAAAHGADNANYPAVDMKIVQAVTGYDALPATLRTKFEARCALDENLQGLWDGKLAPLQKDESRSGFEFALAGCLKTAGDYTPTEFGQLLRVYEHGHPAAEITAHLITRAWDNAPSQPPRIETADGFEPCPDEWQRPVPSPSEGGNPATGWDEPADLWVGTSSQPAELPLGVVPEIIELLARSGGRRLGFEPGPLAAAYSTTFGSLVSAGNQLQMRQLDTDWTVRPILWCMPVADVSSKKTALFAYALKPVRHVEAQWRREHNEAKHRLQPHSATAPTKHGEADAPKQSSDGIFQGVAAAVVPFRQKIVNDATVEAIGALLEKNHSGLLFASDELAGWIGGMDAYRSKGGKDRPFYLQAKDGAPYVINRRGAPRVVIPNCALSILGSVQPAKIRALADDLDDDGLLQRFMPVLIAQYGDGVDELPDEAAQAQANAVAVAIAQSEQTGLFKFAPEAAGELTAIQDFVRRENERPGIVGAMAEWVNKLPNEFGRVALVFHFVNWHTSQIGRPTPEPIPALVPPGTAKQARRFLTEFVFPHAQMFYGRVLGQSTTDKQSAWLAGYILSRKRDEIKERDIYRDCTILKKKDRRGDILAVMHDLEMQDWVKPSGFKQGKPNKWKVNPMVHDGRFAGVAATEKERRTGAQVMIARAAAERRGAVSTLST